MAGGFAFHTTQGVEIRGGGEGAQGGGEVVGREPLEAARARHLAARAELPVESQQMSRGEPVIPTLHV